MARFNLGSNDVKDCKGTTAFVKKCRKFIEFKKNGILNLVYQQGLLFEKSKKCNKSSQNSLVISFK